MSTGPRRAYRRGEVHATFGAGFSLIDRLVREGTIRAQKVGHGVFLNAEDVHRVFLGEEPEDSRPVRAEVLAQVREFVG